MALLAQEFPQLGGKMLSERRCAGAVGGVGGFDKIKGSLEEECGVSEGNCVGPGNVFGGVGRGGGLEFDAFVVVNNAVVSGGVSMPERPPSALVLWECAVSGGGGEEMTIVDACF